MDLESVHPRLTYLFGALLLASLAASALNAFVLYPAGFDDAFGIVTTVTFMTPVVILLSIAFDERGDRYREKPGAHHAGDLFFTVTGSIVGTAVAVTVLLDTGLTGLARDAPAMLLGFGTGWAFFWWRNRDVFLPDE